MITARSHTASACFQKWFFYMLMLLLVQPWSAVPSRGQVQNQGQPARYSSSAEYQQMLAEIRSAAPSPAYIATGLRPRADPQLAVQIEDKDQFLTLSTGAALFRLDKRAVTLTVTTRQTLAHWTISPGQDALCPAQPGTIAGTPVAQTMRVGNRWSFSVATPCGTFTVGLELLTSGLARLTIASATGRSLPLHVEGGGPFFGLGERFWQAGLSGTSLDVRPQDRYGEPGHNWTYVAIPFLYTPGGLGIYADTAFDTQFRINQADSSFDLEVTSTPVSFYLFTEPTPKAVLSAYTALTGRPQNPPLWTFGPWITALQGKGSVLETAHRIRTEHMPASALWIYDQNDEADNLGWPFWFASYYGDPRTFTDTLHGLGFKVLTYVHPYLRSKLLPYNTSSSVFDQSVTDKLLVTGADGQPAGPRFELVPVGNLDFTNPRAVDLWQTMITSAVRDQGFDGWMEDFGEWVRDTDRFAAGAGRTLSELYPLLYHKITLRIAQALNPAVVPFSRSGSPGSQAFSPVLWGADQSPTWSRDYGLPSVVTAGITAGMSGYSIWGPDILSVGSNKELWMRWVEFGALTPVMRDHVWDKPEHSFNLWSDAETTAHFRRWASFHASLLPYFATYAAEAARTGIPIMRHTVLEFPDDPLAAKAEYQYFLGRELLIAPVVQPGATMRTLYLPRGEWVDFWDGNFYTGGQEVLAQASQIPILVRAGSVLPLMPEEEASRWDWDDPTLLDGPLVWKAYLSSTGTADSSFTLPNGTAAHFTQHGTSAVIQGQSATVREYEIILRTRQAPSTVRLNGQRFASYSKSAAWTRTQQWWWNSSTNEVHLRFRAKAFQVELEGVTARQYQ